MDNADVIDLLAALPADVVDDKSIPLNIDPNQPSLPPGEWIPLDRYKLFRIIQVMVDAVLVFDREQYVQLCNKAFERTFEVTQGAIFGQFVPDLFAQLAPQFAEELHQVFTTGKSETKEVTFYHDQRKKVFLLTTMPIEDDGEISEGVAVFRDITVQKQIEKMRRDFVANVSHELRTPLSAINGYAETLLEGALDDKSVAEDFIKIIFNHSQRLSHLVRDLLDLSKIESSEFSPTLLPVDITALIRKVIHLNEKSLREKQIRLHSVLPDDFPRVLAHESSIEQVLMNLLDNAAKYTSAEGAISIRVVELENRIRVDVEDTGIGIEPKYISRVFERFYRVDKARSRDLGGTGLGLSIVKHIIQYHGGEVWAESTPGQGSTFSFVLKIAPRADETEESR